MLFTEKVLFVDDEQNVLSAIKRQLYTIFNLDVADSGDSALTKLQEEGPFGVIVVDMRMPVMDGLTLLKKVQKVSPNTIRLMLTGNVDVQTAQNAINEGNIFRYMVKPCPSSVMVQNIMAALRQYQLLKSEKELLEDTLSSTVRVMVDILSLVNPVSFSKTQRYLSFSKHIIHELELENPWQYEIAVMLSQIGTVIVPENIIYKQYNPENLTKEDKELLAHHPLVTKKLIESIPRMEQVSQMIEKQNYSLDELLNKDNNIHQNIVFGAQLIRISTEIDRLLVSGISIREILDKLKSQPTQFNRKFVDALDTYKFEKDYSNLLMVTVDKLDSFMVANQDIVDLQGRVLLAKDQEITVASIEYLRSFAKRVGIKEPFQVKIVRPSF